MSAVAGIIQAKVETKNIDLAKARGQVEHEIDRLIGQLNVARGQDYHSISHFMTHVGTVIEAMQQVNLISFQKDAYDALLVRID